LRLTGKGAPSSSGGPPGDLYLKVNVRQHPVFTREGDNLIMEKKIPFSEACLGTTVEITTLDGKTFKVKVPAGVQQESKLRLKGHGLPSGPIGKRGDIFVKMLVKIPKKMSREQKKAVKQLAEVGL
jgi:curved DNA-binding protein